MIIYKHKSIRNHIGGWIVGRHHDNTKDYLPNVKIYYIFELMK